jgi:2-polyprenyl-3-methyl-5-hydroxy-6-metoxy-1,4-benzoquinol methylase
LVVFTTINNSFLGTLFGKYFAENVLKILPVGTHEVEKFVSPENLAIEAEKHGIILDNFTGFSPTFRFKNIINKEFGNFKLSSNMQINYGAAGIKL